MKKRRMRFVRLKTGFLRIPKDMPYVYTCNKREANHARVIYTGKKEIPYIIFLMAESALTDDVCQTAIAQCRRFCPDVNDNVQILRILDHETGVGSGFEKFYTMGTKIIRDKDIPVILTDRIQEKIALLCLTMRIWSIRLSRTLK